MAERHWRWLSRLTDLGQIIYWIGGSSLLTGAIIATSAAISGLPFAMIATYGLLAVFAVLGIGTFLTFWLQRPTRLGDAHYPDSSTVGALVEQYAVNNAMRFEAEARQSAEESRRAADESRKDREQREAAERREAAWKDRVDTARKIAVMTSLAWAA
jgi:hypothetical protein